MSDIHQASQPTPETQPQIYPPVEPQPQPMPPATTDTPIGTPPPEGTPFVAAFPNADEASVLAAEEAFKDGSAEGVVVNPGPQLGMAAPDEQPTEPPATEPTTP